MRRKYCSQACPSLHDAKPTLARATEFFVWARDPKSSSANGKSQLMTLSQKLGCGGGLTGLSDGT
jgi:hypothetical protein